MKPETLTLNAAALLMDRGNAARSALVCGESTVSWAQLRVAVPRAAAAWLDCGVETGETVQLHMPRGIEQAIALLGAVWVGAVPVPLGGEGVSVCGQPWDERAPCRFILAPSRAPYASRWRDSVLTLDEWRLCTREAGAAASPPPPLPLPPDAPACWTEPRTRDGCGARLLPHSFAAQAPVARRVPDVGATSTVLGMLKVLRRGGTALLCASTRSPAEVRHGMDMTL